jgi:hypothetical protein
MFAGAVYSITATCPFVKRRRRLPLSNECSSLYKEATRCVAVEVGGKMTVIAIDPFG